MHTHTHAHSQHMLFFFFPSSLLNFFASRQVMAHRKDPRHLFGAAEQFLERFGHPRIAPGTSHSGVGSGMHHIYIYMYMYIYIYTCVYIYIYVYVYVCV